MVKKSVIQGVAVSVGVAVGGVILPRLLFSGIYHASYPPIWVHAAWYFAVGCAVNTAVALLINAVRTRRQNR